MSVLPTTPGGWPCICADPPWSFRDKGSRIAPDQRRKRQGRKGYRTMPLDAIAALPVGEVAATDALLWLWTTSAHLVDGTSPAVARAWGFTPKVTVAWVKLARAEVPIGVERHLAKLIARGSAEPRAAATAWVSDVERRLRPRCQIGMGHYVRGAHELLLVCTRGRPHVRRHDLPSVIFAPRGPHSAKPDEGMELIEQLCGGPRLELFARRSRLGWTGWGDQLGDEAALEGAA